jgi:hypothetical protein
MSLADSHSIH